MKIWLMQSLVAIAFIGAGSAAAADTVGIMKTVSGSARLERGTTVINAVVGVVVEASDRIVTRSTARVGITLKDDTLLAIGPGSVLIIENFAFDQTTYAGSLAVRMVNGTLHIITGLIARQSPGAVRVLTPNAIIGTRGTDFIVEVPAND